MADNETITQSPEHESGWQELCPGCLTSNRIGEDFCLTCGRPITPYAATGPLEYIRTEGYIYRGAVSGRKSLIILIGIWLICGTPIIASAAMLVSLHVGLGAVFGMAPVLLLFVPILWRATRNYAVSKPIDPPRHEGDVAPPPTPTT